MTLKFQLEPVLQERGVALRTTSALRVFVDQHVIWPVRGDNEAALEVQIDDLLSYLVEFWKPLLLQQTYPLTLNPRRPSELRADALKRWADMPQAQVEREDEEIEAFEEAHELSRCFAGYYELPSLWLIRDLENVLIESDWRVWTVPFPDAVDALTIVGDEIARRLDTPNSRWKKLIAAWREKDKGDALEFLVWQTGLDRSVAAELVSDGLLTAPENLSQAINDNDEVRIAARMASALEPDQIRSLLQLVGRLPLISLPELTRISLAARTHLNTICYQRRSFEQGLELAHFTRRWFSFDEDGPLDLDAMIGQLGLQPIFQDLEPPTLDGLAVWGARHGPAVLINIASDRFASSGAAVEDGAVRATLAHELCHLLVDGEHGLSAVDVLNSRMPASIEQRAKAFAGELLLPCSAARHAWIGAGEPREHKTVAQFLEAVCAEYEVSISVAAFKLMQTIDSSETRLRMVLESIAARRRMSFA